jgi:hypothetical protein
MTTPLGKEAALDLPGAALDLPGPSLDLRRASLAELRTIDFRATDRDPWADEAAMWDRFRVSWAGLDDAAWRLPGAAPSDAGGPDWSLQDHVAHVAGWQELAVEYVERAERTGRWPSDEDYDGGDFDRFNERLRGAWSDRAPAEVRRRLEEGHAALVLAARRLPLETIRSDEAWGWVHMTLHGHQLDHLSIIEPWADQLRDRQGRSDPFVPDPRPRSGDPLGDVAAFWAEEARVMATFDDLVRPVPLERWTSAEVTPGWRLREHVAHLADWFAEGADAVEEHRSLGAWRDGPVEGFDAWNEAALARSADEPAGAVLDRFERDHRRLRVVARSLTPADLLSDEGWSWVYECLHGHVRAHLAMVGPWCARAAWPAEEG